MSRVHARRLLLAGGAALALVLPAQATAGPVSADRVTDCAPSFSARAGGGVHRHTSVAPTYSRRELRRIDRRLDRRLERRNDGTTTWQGIELRIGVHVHVISARGDRGPSKRVVMRQLELLDQAYAGAQSEESAGAMFRFYLESFERVRNNRWHDAAIGSPAELDMRRTLHRGGREDLNLYVAEPRDPHFHSVVLGWSSAPWQARRYPQLDGVTVHEGSLPGGSLRGYNLGDTAVHEIGHWLGLLHTFEGGGCEGPGDLVADTPAQSIPSMSCQGDKDTCPGDGMDPVHNFMDYAVDECMDQFTPGQVTRMTDNWLAYRTP
jgi:hypothetical protein